jgi:hypothetical protein
MPQTYATRDQEIRRFKPSHRLAALPGRSRVLPDLRHRPPGACEHSGDGGAYPDWSSPISRSRRLRPPPRPLTIIV